jgi:drug/metabolite transporter (DMT)-like permease
MTAPFTEPAIAATPTSTGAKAGAYLALAGGILCIGCGPIFVKLAGTPGDVTAFYRLLIASLALIVPAALNWRRGKARLPRAAVGIGVLGGLAFAVNLTMWATALTLTTAANATLLDNTAPLWVGIGAWLLFREKLQTLFWLGLAVAMVGATIIVGLDAFRGFVINAGDLIALVAGVIYAVYLLITQRARERIDNLTYLWLFTTSGLIIVTVYTTLLGNLFVGLPLKSYLALLGLGLISQMGGWLLINHAMGQLRASLIAVTLLGQPITATLLAVLILGEIPNAWIVVGGLITLAGIYIVLRQGSR